MEKGERKLFPIKALSSVPLVGKGRAEWAGPQRSNQSAGDDVHSVQHGIGQQCSAVIKDGTVAVEPVLLKDGDVVQMPVVVEKQGIQFKQRRQVLRKLRESRVFCRELRQIGDPLFVAGEPCQLLLQGKAQNTGQQTVYGNQGLTGF